MKLRRIDYTKKHLSENSAHSKISKCNSKLDHSCIVEMFSSANLRTTRQIIRNMINHNNGSKTRSSNPGTLDVVGVIACAAALVGVTSTGAATFLCRTPVTATGCDSDVAAGSSEGGTEE